MAAVQKIVAAQIVQQVKGQAQPLSIILKIGTLRKFLTICS